MPAAALYDEAALDEGDALYGLGDQMDAELFGEEEASDGALDALAAELDLDDLDALDDESDLWDAADEDGMGDELGDFALDAGTGLFVPQAPRLVTGPAALALARRLNPAVLQAMDADDAEAFLRRVGGFVRRATRRVAPGLARAGQALGRVAQRAAPLLRRALPMIQRVAGFAGPWGRLVSAGIGAAQGLMEGRGVRGALAGAVGGLIPGVGGQIASSILRGDGADDDAALDALADMADAGEVDAAVALPEGAGLAARLTVRRGLGGAGRGALPGGVLSGDRRVWSEARQAERIMLAAARAARGSTGRRLRILRAIGRLASALVQQQRIQRGPAAAAQAVPAAVRAASRRVLGRVAQDGRAGASTPQQAARRNAARRQVMRQVPASAVFRGRGQLGVAG